MDPKAYVYQAVGCPDFPTGKSCLDRATEAGAVVTEREPFPMSTEAAVQGFKQKRLFRIELADGHFTHVYWQPARDARDLDHDGHWYGRATQWEKPLLSN